MLCELAVLDADDVGRNPGDGPSAAGEPAVEHHVVALGDGELVLVAQRIGQGTDQFEESVSPGRNMSAMLDVAIRPIAFSSRVIALVEECVESFKDKGLVL